MLGSDPPASGTMSKPVLEMLSLRCTYGVSPYGVLLYDSSFQLSETVWKVTCHCSYDLFLLMMIGRKNILTVDFVHRRRTKAVKCMEILMVRIVA